MQSKYSLRNIISKTLIVVGLALILVSVGYEIVTYPWVSILAANDPKGYPMPPDPPSRIESNDEYLEEEPAETLEELPGSDTYISPSSTTTAASYHYLGVIKIPKNGVSVNIYEGSGEQMRVGVGHVTGSSKLGAKGNCVLVGHRAYIKMHPFRYNNKLLAGDKIILKVNENVYSYSVYENFLVWPNEAWVMQKVENEENIVTLITCDPVVKPTQRLIIRARLDEE